MLKDRVLDKLSDAGFMVWKKSRYRKNSSHESFFGSSPIIDADFVEVDDVEIDEDFFCDPDPSSKSESGPIELELLEKIREYLKTRSEEEILEIIKDVRKILESRDSESDFRKSSEEEILINQRSRLKKVSRNALKIFLETASYGRKQIISASKAASSKASSMAFEGKESIVDSSKKLNEKWNNLSPGDRKIILELIVVMIEIWILKRASRNKQASFSVLSSMSKRQTPARKDLEDFEEGLQNLFKSKH